MAGPATPSGLTNRKHHHAHAFDTEAGDPTEGGAGGAAADGASGSGDQDAHAPGGCASGATGAVGGGRCRARGPRPSRGRGRGTAHSRPRCPATCARAHGAAAAGERVPRLDPAPPPPPLHPHHPSPHEELPPWQRQITVRGSIVGAGIGLLFCIITMRLALGTAGIVPRCGAFEGVEV
jgi:hypothetical protein